MDGEKSGILVWKNGGKKVGGTSLFKVYESVVAQLFRVKKTKKGKNEHILKGNRNVCCSSNDMFLRNRAIVLTLVIGVNCARSI